MAMIQNITIDQDCDYTETLTIKDCVLGKVIKLVVNGCLNLVLFVSIDTTQAP